MAMTLHTRLLDGTPVVLRPITPDDEGRLREGIDRLSDHSRYLRFFSGARRLPDHVIEKLAAADGHAHIAWGAMGVSTEIPRAIAAAHAMREDNGPEAELAFAVLDDYHGLGLARTLISAVILDCVHEGVDRLTADVLAENRNARKLLRHFGARKTGGDGLVTRYKIDIDEALSRIHEMKTPKGVQAVIAALSGQPRRFQGYAA